MTFKLKNYFLILLSTVILSGIIYSENSNSSSNNHPNNDYAITVQIKKKVLSDNPNQKINVFVKNGIVKLSGTAISETIASDIIEYAESLKNVREVDTRELHVKNSTQPFTDAFITAKVKGRFIKEKLFGTSDIASFKISVETKNGIVYLSGEADNQTQIDTAAKIAKSTEGVTDVISTAKVKDDNNENM